MTDPENPVKTTVPLLGERDLVLWALALLCLAVGLALGGRWQEDGAGADGYGIAAALVAIALATLVGRRSLAIRLGTSPGEPTTSRHPLVALFVISFVVLFVEVLLIRYTSAQFRVFSFYKNVPLVGCFLGLGLGCYLGRGGPRQILLFLAWLFPLAVFLSQGAPLLDSALGRWAATGSSEHILGDVVERQGGGADWLSQLAMGIFCVVTFVVICALFVALGRLLGQAFVGVSRLPAYNANILGSLSGILGFAAMGQLQTPPPLWVAVGTLPLLAWLKGARRGVALLLILASVVVVGREGPGETLWSPYQKLVGKEIPAGPGGTGTDTTGYLVRISDVFYQVAVDLGPEAIAQLGFNPFPHYDLVYRGLENPGRVLVVGAGTGNDVAAALRAGAEQVDAVDIDPAILELGRQHHPEKPYADPRVHWVVDDARAAFRRLPAGSYDVVVFGLLDSHTQLGISSVRLDNYVFTVESLRSAAALLRPGGRLVVSAAVFRPWFGERIQSLVRAGCGAEPEIEIRSNWVTYFCQVDDPPTTADGPALPRSGEENDTDALLPTDDWPFLYLPERGIPRAYLVVLALLVIASLTVLRIGGLGRTELGARGAHLFFLGAAFLLIEVYAINRLALLFGTTWRVSAVTIAGVLLLIVLGNFTIVRWPGIPYGLAYSALFLTLSTGWWLGPEVALGHGMVAALAYSLLLLSPIYFAALVFARSFSASVIAGPALGANILGSVLGGWIEYATMAVGIRAMALLALVFYLLSLLALLRSQNSREA